MVHKNTKEDFLRQLDVIQQRYEEEERRNDQFNIFSALHKKHNEKFLHSRFISYLLSPTSKHKMQDKFLTAFIETISVEYPELKKFVIKNCTVRPNEDDKTEYKDIDILIKNDNQAIVIENKIYAGDQTDNREDTDNQIQINRYCNAIKANGIGNKDIFAIYLTLDRHDPERIDEIKKDYFLFKIDYHKEIKNWLDRCVDIADTHLLKEIITQYQTVVLTIASDLQRIDSFIELIRCNPDLAWENWERIKRMRDFKHIKWRTVADFWNELSLMLQQLGAEVPKNSKITVKEITKVTHGNKSGKTDRTPYGINIRMPSGKERYVVNDANNGLTHGELHPTDEKTKDWVIIDDKIKFSEFDNQATFELIDSGNRKKLIEKVIDSLKE